MKKLILLVAALIIIGAAGYLYVKKTNVSQRPLSSSPSQTQTSTNQTPQPTATPITFTDQGFVPNTITIKKGQTVTWTNKSSEGMWVASAFHPTHTAYDGTSLSQHCPNPSGTAFDQCSDGAAFSFIFTKAGTWKYHNHLDFNKTGSVTVTEQ